VSALVDTSILIDYLRGHESAGDLLERERASSALHGSEITRLEVLAGMRSAEEEPTRLLLSTLVWHDVDAEVAEKRVRWVDSGCPAITASTAPTSPLLRRRS
jgi:predicted nucleic acid-binding protein